MKIPLILVMLISMSFVGLKSTCYLNNQDEMDFHNCIIPYAERVLMLKTAYNEYVKATNIDAKNDYAVNFFHHFPCSFSTFDSIYGYYPLDENKGDLRPFVDKHLELLFSLKAVLFEAKTNRIVNIAKNARWVDSMEFQYYLQQDIAVNTIDYFKEIQVLSNEEIFNLWYYFFDGPHPENYKELFKELYAKGYNWDKNIAELMQKAYYQLLSEKKCDGH